MFMPNLVNLGGIVFEQELFWGIWG